MKKKKVAIIGTNGIPARYGGFETLANYLVEFLKNDFQITVYCSKTPRKKRLKDYNSARLKYIPLKANGWQSMLYDFIAIFHSFFNADKLIILGFSGAFAFPFNRIWQKNIVFNIGGIEWRKVRGTKYTAGFEVQLKKWMERLCVKNSTTVIIDNPTFDEYLRNRYGIIPVVAEYGGDHARYEPLGVDISKKYSFVNSQYDLSVSRAQEDMNVHMIIDAYKNVPERTVVIISNWKISEYGRNLFSENQGKYPNVILLNAIYDTKTLNTIRCNCALYIHSHSLCGTAPSLVEAMSLNLPVISFDVPANRATTKEKALYFKDSHSLSELIVRVSSDELETNRLEMKRIAASRYTWERIAGIYKTCLEKQ